MRNILVIVLLVFVVGLIGYIAFNTYQLSVDKNESKQENPQTTDNEPISYNLLSKPQAHNHPAEWYVYQSAGYKIAFAIPPNAEVSTIEYPDSESSSLNQVVRWSITPRNSANTEFGVEIVASSPEAAASSWYDEFFSGYKSVTKTSETVKGHRALVYKLESDGVKSKVYLIQRGNHTIVFEHLYEKLDSNDIYKLVENSKIVFDSLNIGN